MVHLDFRISLRIFEKIINDPKVFFKGFREDDSLKKPEAKNLVTLHCPFSNLLELSTWVKVPQKGWRTILIFIFKILVESDIYLFISED